jgi:excisionase family DNA binding protein
MTKRTTTTATRPAADVVDQAPLTIPEAAQALRVSVPTIRSWIAQGTLTSVRPPHARRHLIERSEVARLLGRAS